MFSADRFSLSDEERQTLTNIYARLQTKCMAVAVKMVKDKVQAEDIVHSAFVKILENRKKILTLSCHEQDAYIVITIKNKAIDFLRGHKPTESLWHDTNEKLFAYVPPLDTESSFESKEGYENLKAMIKRLPENYRVAFEMRYLQGLSNAEIAEVLGIKNNTVAKHLERAKQRLKQIIKESGDFHG